MDSDTQTPASAIQASRAKVASSRSPKDQLAADAAGKELSNHSLSSTGNESNASNSNSTSNSNNSASSNDSVIFRPSSADELESGVDSDSNAVNVTYKPTDHISSLRQAQAKEAKSKKMETTFDSDIRTETKDPKRQVSQKETTFGDDVEEVIDIKPMQPIMRSMPYSYLRNLGSGPLPKPSLHISSNMSSQNTNSASSRLGINRPLLDPHKLYSSHKSMTRTVSSCTSVVDTDYGSDVEFDMSGYMSDGDVLRSNHPDDINSGYMSEGGASLYARRMQQRFREGMQAVRECMQKSSGVIDDDR